METDFLLIQFKEFSLKKEQHEEVAGGAVYRILTSTGMFLEEYDSKGYVGTRNMLGTSISQSQLDATEDVGAVRCGC